MFGLGAHELLIVGIVAVILFGRKLPDVARSLGSSYREFRKGLNEFQSSVNVDSYSATSSSCRGSTAAPRLHDDYADAATAPKFEPPVAEPQAASADTVGVESGPAEEKTATGNS